LITCQKAAVRHIRSLAKENHERALEPLKARVLALGLTENDLLLGLAWVSELAPVIVHMNLDNVGRYLESDTHYRNQFETNTSEGLVNLNARTAWENKLFGYAYDDAKPFERPKYGVQNIWNDPKGVTGCLQYGDSYLVLKDVRLRCTLSPEDSGGIQGRRLAVLDHYAHVMLEYSDKELLETLRIAKGGAEHLGDSAKVVEAWGKYKEVQIHGEVNLSKHVRLLVVNERHRSESDWIHKLAAAHDLPVSWINDFKQTLTEHAGGRELSTEDWTNQLEKVKQDNQRVPGNEPKGGSQQLAPSAAEGPPVDTNAPAGLPADGVAVAAEEETLTPEQAAVRIQAICRGKAGRRRVVGRLKASEEEPLMQDQAAEEETLTPEQAAVRIQATCRGKAGRRFVGKLKADAVEAPETTTM